MSKNQRIEIKNLIKQDQSENILKKMIKNEKRPYNTKKIIVNNKIAKRMATIDPDKTQRYLTNMIVSSTHRVKKHDRENNKSFYNYNTFNRIEQFSLNRLNLLDAIKGFGSTKNIHQKVDSRDNFKVMHALKSYGSTKDLSCNYRNNNHTTLTSGQHDKSQVNFKTQMKTVKKKLNIKNTQLLSNPSSKTAAVLYKRNETNKNNISFIYSSLNTVSKNIKDSYNNINNNNFNKYQLNSATYNTGKNEKKNASDIYCYYGDNQIDSKTFKFTNKFMTQNKNEKEQ